MDENNFLTEQFQAKQVHLRGVAFRMLGSLHEAEDALQEAWLRISRADASGVENLGGWLTTIVARVCLDMLRSRKSRREKPLDTDAPEAAASHDAGDDPEQEALLADAVGLALLVVLERLPPAERVAFVLHDLFDLPFEEIGPIVGRSSTAARQLASRGRRRVQGRSEDDTERNDAAASTELVGQHKIVEAFLAASRGGNFDALVAALDPDVVMRSDRTATQAGGPGEVRGAAAVAGFFRGRAQLARPALINGAVGAVVAPRGRLFLALAFTIKEGRIVELNAIADPQRLQELELAVLTA